jgi:spore cortex formation protein SpoVR/YcgB (stage V sporulation)
LLGASTDFSSYGNEGKDELMHGSGGWNIYHFSSGMSYHKQKHTVTLGLSYAITSSKNIPPYAIINQTPEFTDKALLTAHSYSVVLGYTYFFARTE